MEREVESKAVEGANTQAAGIAARKPYGTPKLRRLGSVRELTFGSAGVLPDAGTSRGGN